MTLRLTKDDKQMLVSIAEYRVLTAGLLGVLHERNTVALRRRITLLRSKGLIHLTACTLRQPLRDREMLASRGKSPATGGFRLPPAGITTACGFRQRLGSSRRGCFSADSK